MSSPAEQHHRDFAAAMIDWLSDKDPDIWFYISQSLNWDYSQAVLDWIVAQPACDKANIALIFIRLNPDEMVEESFGPAEDQELFTLFKTILTNWNAGFYERSELTLDPSEVGDMKEMYYSMVKNRVDGTDRFKVPAAIFGPFEGRVAAVPENLLVENNPRLAEIFNGLGTHFED